ncbi:PREDICTED: vacuolar protein 8-like [Ipomoea nil]|uniref:vacuolar protein 8-like n=1 Tax=Ipomoea nil TaxID=35883 RepID=UPI000900A846|nr:PREDICTED: vacuolar protein 8-like [Ipomoea nil]
MVDNLSAEEWLWRSQELVPVALEKARKVKGFPSRWKVIISKLEQIPSRLSDLSTHPFFSKNALCKEQLQAVWNTLNEAIEFAEMCAKEKYEGKLRMQSDLDVLSGKLDLSLRDCGLLIKTRMLGEVTMNTVAEPEPDRRDLRELLARLQIGHLEAKHRALDGLLEAMKDDENTILEVLTRSNVSAIVQLLTASSPQMREKAVTVICSLSESGCCEKWLVSEKVIPPLIRLLDSGSSLGKEKAAISLQRLSMSAETAGLIVGHGGIRPLIEICHTQDSVSQAAAACALKNISVVPEARQGLGNEGVVEAMINLLDCSTGPELKDYAAQCLQNITSGSSDDELRRCVIEEGGLPSLVSCLPHESAVGALANLVGYVPVETLVSLGVLPRLVHVVRCGSIGAKQSAVSAICRISTSPEAKKAVGESGCIPLLVKTLVVAKENNGLREAAAQAISILMTLGQNCREVKKDDDSVPNLVQLLDPSPHNAAKKYAASCLVLLSSSKKCKKLMISHGAIGYLKKLSEMDVPGAKKLLERLERGNSISGLFSR